MRDAGSELTLSAEEGQAVRLPFSVSDEDGDAVTVLYRTDDDVTWSVLPASSEVNVLPASLASRFLAMPGTHTVEVTAFDGLDVSDGSVPFCTSSSKQGRWRENPPLPKGVEFEQKDVFEFPEGKNRVSQLLDSPHFRIERQSVNPLAIAYELDGGGFASPYPFPAKSYAVHLLLPYDRVQDWSNRWHSIEFFLTVPETDRQKHIRAYIFSVDGEMNVELDRKASKCITSCKQRTLRACRPIHAMAMRCCGFVSSRSDRLRAL
jgi:hypothetical protein